MKRPEHQHPGVLPARRRFLQGAAATAGVIGAACLVPPVARAGSARTLSLVHTHTGEALTIPYAGPGCYEAGCLNEVNRLLRDFRTGDVHRIDPGLLDILGVLQDRSGSDAPFEVICGYRSPATNAMLRGASRTSGVAEHSLHLEGQAIDVRLGGVRTPKLAELARGLQRGGVGYYAASDFVHVDTGRVRHW